jgi:hypothetical protein
MSSVDERLGDALARGINLLPGAGVWALAILLYASGVAGPLLLGWSIPYLVMANILGAMFAGLVILVWLARLVDESRRRDLLEWTSDLRRLDSREFEWLVGEVFRREGWQVTETGSPNSPDGNVDLRLQRDERWAIVQCKRWTAWQVGVDEVRRLAGTIMREGLTGRDGYLVTLSMFTPDALAEAKQVGITTIDGRDLIERVEAVRRKEPCPVCDSSMRLERSTYGWWFRCTAEGCMGKRDLSADPIRALELLTDHA